MVTVANTVLQIFIVLHYFGEFTAIGKKPDVVHETADLILVEEGRVEIA